MWRAIRQLLVYVWLSGWDADVAQSLSPAPHTALKPAAVSTTVGGQLSPHMVALRGLPCDTSPADLTSHPSITVCRQSTWYQTWQTSSSHTSEPQTRMTFLLMTSCPCMSSCMSCYSTPATYHSCQKSSTISHAALGRPTHILPQQHN